MARTEKQLANLRVPTSKEAREIGAKGGKKSVENRKKKKLLDEIIKRILDLQPDDKDRDKLEQMGLQDKEVNNATFFAYSLFKNGCSGNNKAMELVAEVLNGNDKKELELEKAQQEIERLKLEQEKLKRDLGNGSDSFEDLTPLADLIRRKEK